MSGTSDRLNIIIMYADDLGFGDIGCYGATGIATPNLDRLASEGLRFTQGYAAAATCTPSRYALLTGGYPWRNEDAHVLSGTAPLIIPPGSDTLPSMLREAGYVTGVVGKWHLGIGEGNADWNSEMTSVPLDVGFDYSYVMPATNDRVPCVYLENRTVEGLDASDPIEVTYDNDRAFPDVPTGRDNPELLKVKYSHGHDKTIVNGISRIGYMRGGADARWKDEEMAGKFLDRAVSFVTENRNESFFLYYAFHQPHVPRVPNSRFAGVTDRGARGDVIAEMDWCVGEMLKTLDRLGLSENTIVIFSSDNGPVLDDGYEDLSVELCGEHRPAGPLRGGKYSMYDGGTRVPFILRWTGTVRPGESSAVVCHTDFFASFASMAGSDLDPDAAIDSMDVLSALLGTSETGRYELVTEGVRKKTVLRQGDMVFIPPYPGPARNKSADIEMGNSPVPQLYDLSKDIGQVTNQAAERPDLTEAMSRRLQEICDSERTRPA